MNKPTSSAAYTMHSIFLMLFFLALYGGGFSLIMASGIVTDNTPTSCCSHFCP